MNRQGLNSPSESISKDSLALCARVDESPTREHEHRLVFVLEHKNSHAKRISERERLKFWNTPN